MSTHLSLMIPGIVTGEADGLVAVISLVVIVTVLVVARHLPSRLADRRHLDHDPHN